MTETEMRKILARVIGKSYESDEPAQRDDSLADLVRQAEQADESISLTDHQRAAADYRLEQHPAVLEGLKILAPHRPHVADDTQRFLIERYAECHRLTDGSPLKIV